MMKADDEMFYNLSYRVKISIDYILCYHAYKASNEQA